MKITDLDKNFLQSSKIDRDGLVFIQPTVDRFSIHGVMRDADSFCRIPPEVAKSISPGVRALSRHTAGGRIRFVTDSPYVALRVKLNSVSHFSHMPYTGISGVDMFLKHGTHSEFVGCFAPPGDNPHTTEFEGVKDLGVGMHDIVLNLPLYSGVDEILIGLKSGSVIKSPSRYKIEKPVVFYGSSITQGGCASRAGMTYEAILSSMLDFDYINLGFSGNALGEREMAEYIGDLDMSLFVLDYDHNAPSLCHLEQTHKTFFDIIRAKNPTLPILILSTPSRIENREKRIEVIRRTYNAAKERGDENVYFIDGRTLFDFCMCDATVDGVHPTDLGFFSMAHKIYPVLKEMLKSLDK